MPTPAAIDYLASSLAQAHIALAHASAEVAKLTVENEKLKSELVKLPKKP